MTKYEALGQYLDHCEALQITLSFKTLERLLGCGLPAEAKADREWWANRRTGNARQCDAWTRAGWQVCFADLHRREVTFVKYTVAKAAAAG